MHRPPTWLVLTLVAAACSAGAVPATGRVRGLGGKAVNLGTASDSPTASPSPTSSPSVGSNAAPGAAAKAAPGAHHDPTVETAPPGPGPVVDGSVRRDGDAPSGAASGTGTAGTGTGSASTPSGVSPAILTVGATVGVAAVVVAAVLMAVSLRRRRAAGAVATGAGSGRAAAGSAKGLGLGKLQGGATPGPTAPAYDGGASQSQEGGPTSQQPPRPLHRMNTGQTLWIPAQACAPAQPPRKLSTLRRLSQVLNLTSGPSDGSTNSVAATMSAIAAAAAAAAAQGSSARVAPDMDLGPALCAGDTSEDDDASSTSSSASSSSESSGGSIGSAASHGLRLRPQDEDIVVSDASDGSSCSASDDSDEDDVVGAALGGPGASTVKVGAGSPVTPGCSPTQEPLERPNRPTLPHVASSGSVSVPLDEAAAACIVSFVATSTQPDVVIRPVAQDGREATGSSLFSTATLTLAPSATALGPVGSAGAAWERVGRR
jgi:hypothetical protein